MNFFEKKAQGAIEYLLIIGAAILVVAIVIIAVTSVLSQGQNQTSTGAESASSAVDSLKETSGAYVRLNNHYYIKSDPITQDLVALWHFDDLTNVAVDSSGNKKDGIVKNGVATGVIGVAGSSAFSFDGIDDYVSFNTGALENLTISFWMKTFEAPAPEYTHIGLITTTYAGNTQGISLANWSGPVQPFGSRSFYWRDNGNANDVWVAQAGKDYFLGDLTTFHNYVIVKNKKEVKIYRDGIFFINDYRLSSNFENDWSPNIIAIGQGFCDGCVREGNTKVNLDYINATIDEVIVWNKALSASDVNVLYTNTFSK